jgi:hypothetical protein
LNPLLTGQYGQMSWMAARDDGQVVLGGAMDDVVREMDTSAPALEASFASFDSS